MGEARATRMWHMDLWKGRAETRVLAPADSDGRALVASVVPGSSAGLLVLDGGSARGLPPGAVCTVSRDGRPFGTVVVAEAARSRSVALILSLDPAADAPAARIQPGDVVATRANPRI